MNFKSVKICIYRHFFRAHQLIRLFKMDIITSSFGISRQHSSRRYNRHLVITECSLMQKSTQLYQQFRIDRTRFVIKAIMHLFMEINICTYRLAVEADQIQLWRLAEAIESHIIVEKSMKFPLVFVWPCTFHIASIWRCSYCLRFVFLFGMSIARAFDPIIYCFGLDAAVIMKRCKWFIFRSGIRSVEIGRRQIDP